MVAAARRCDPLDQGGQGSWDCTYGQQTTGDHDTPYAALDVAGRHDGGVDADLMRRGLVPYLVRRERTKVRAKQRTDWPPDYGNPTGPWLSNREVR